MPPIREFEIFCGDCRDILPTLPRLADACICDPPYGLKFMGKGWDHGVPGPDFWKAILDACKPGAHLLAFGSTRTFHRLGCAIEDAGWELRDTLGWITGQGFPKSYNVGCKCRGGALPYVHEEETEPKAKREVYSVRNKDVSPPLDSQEWRGEVLQSGLPQQSSSELWATGSKPETSRSEQSSLERRRDVLEKARELQADQVCAVSEGVSTDGAEGRLHHGASSSNGPIAREASGKGGSGPSQEPQSAGQPTVEFGTVSEQRPSQEGGVGENKICPKCGGLIDWSGWGTALKPAWEPIFLARKPLDGTVAENVQKYGTGALNIDACRVEGEAGSGVWGSSNENCQDGRTFNQSPAGKAYRSSRPLRISHGKDSPGKNTYGSNGPGGGSHAAGTTTVGRWPANLAHDGSQEVLAVFPQSGGGHWSYKQAKDGGLYKHGLKDMPDAGSDTSSGSAARFFYCAKASKQDRDEGCESMPAVKSGMSNGAQLHGEGYDKGQDIGLNRVIQRRNHHPTVKPTALMRYLVKLVSRPGHTILDPFSGSGSTGKAAILEARQFLGIELQPEYVQIATARLSHAVKLHQESSAQQNLL